MIQNVTLTTKERYLLEDEQSHEEQCILKYDNYANLASDNQLKAVFRANGQQEKEHLQTINQLLSGKVPAMGGMSQSAGQNSGQSPMQSSSQSAMPGGITSQQSSVEASSSGSTSYKASDKDFCTDMLMMEKYVSGTYDTAIFEFTNAKVRDVLNHIQKEEQKHGEAIFAYMISKGMYTPK